MTRPTCEVMFWKIRTRSRSVSASIPRPWLSQAPRLIVTAWSVTRRREAAIQRRLSDFTSVPWSERATTLPSSRTSFVRVSSVARLA